MSNETWHKVYCDEKNKKNRVCANWLGALDLSRPGSTMKYCKICNTCVIYRVKAGGLIVREVVKKNIRFSNQYEAQ